PSVLLRAGSIRSVAFSPPAIDKAARRAVDLAAGAHLDESLGAGGFDRLGLSGPVDAAARRAGVPGRAAVQSTNPGLDVRSGAGLSLAAHRLAPGLARSEAPRGNGLRSRPPALRCARAGPGPLHVGCVDLQRQRPDASIACRSRSLALSDAA